MKYLKFSTDCWFTLLVLLFVLEILKKLQKALKMTSKYWSFSELFKKKKFNKFYFPFFRSPDPKSKKIPVNQLIKKIWPKVLTVSCDFISVRNEFQDHKALMFIFISMNSVQVFFYDVAHMKVVMRKPIFRVSYQVRLVVLLLLTCCLLLLPLWESVIVLGFVVRYLVSILVLQLS